MTWKRDSCFVNVIEFDQTWGHRNDVAGFHQGLSELDAWLPRLVARLRREDLVILTADHGNDRRRRPPITRAKWCRCWSWDRRCSRRPRGATDVRRLGQTVADYFGVTRLAAGTSFLGEVWA